MKDKHYWMPRTIFVIMIILMAMIVGYFCTGCDSFKHFTSGKSDTSSVSNKHLAVDDTTRSGSVKKEDTKSHEENEWFRTTIQYLQAHPAGGDTTIINNNSYPQPATVIYESGKGSRDEQKTTVDSSWYFNIMRMIAASTDSMSRKMETIEKTKKVEAVGSKWIPMIIIIVSLGVLYEIYKGVKSKWKLIKK